MTDLVLQAPRLDVALLDRVAAMTRAPRLTSLDAVGGNAWRLHEIGTREGVAEACAAARADYAFVPPELTRDRVRALAMDMDSTLITIECIDEIAAIAGIKDEIAAITASTMAGALDFRESLARRVARFAGMSEDVLARVYDERLALSPGAQALVAGFRASGATTLLVSGGFTYFTERLKARLGIDAALANTLEIESGHLTGKVRDPIVDAQAKAERIALLRRALPAGAMIVAVGDGANDLPMLAAADYSIAYRAKPVVRAQAHCAIDYCGLDAILNLFAPTP